MKRANIYLAHRHAGVLIEDDEGYEFRYLPEFLASEDAEAVSLRAHLIKNANARVAEVPQIWPCRPAP